MCLRLGIIYRSIHEDPHAPHPLRLLRTRTQRPRERCRAPQKGDELAAVHSITSSARSMTDCGIGRPSAFAVFVDKQLERRWLLDRKIGGLCSPKYFIDVLGNTPLNSK
jgi:hypothetical protein